MYQTQVTRACLTTGIQELEKELENENSAVVRVFLGDALREMRRAKYEVEKAIRHVADVELAKAKS